MDDTNVSTILFTRIVYAAATMVKFKWLMLCSVVSAACNSVHTKRTADTIPLLYEYVRKYAYLVIVIALKALSPR